MTEKTNQKWRTYCGEENWFVITSGGDVIAKIPSDEQSKQITEMIAAAPDMFEALKQLIVDYRTLCERRPGNTLLKARLQMAENALARAEGKE